jgi:hypothetical protein
MDTAPFVSPILATVTKIEDGCFNDIITVKMDNGTVIESRGFDMGLKGVPLFKRGDKVKVTLKYNDLSKCFYAIKLDLV